MEEIFQDIDHRAQLVDFWSPSSVSGGAARVYKNLENRFLVGTYAAIGTKDSDRY